MTSFSIVLILMVSIILTVPFTLAMKTIQFKVIGLCVVLLLSQASAAQTLSFNRIEAPERSAILGWITGITQDNQGYVWFTSSNALHRYDGYQITTYLHDASNPNSLAPGAVETVYADRQGIIWIGTQYSGLDRFDPNTGTFTHFKQRPNDNTSLTNNFVSSILEDKQGVLWVGTHGGLDQLDRKIRKFTHYQHNSHDSTSLSNDQVRVLYEDRRGTLWVGTGSPFGETPDGAGGLNRMDRIRGVFTRYLNNPHDSTSLIDNKVRALFEDSHGTFWVGTFGDGLHTMDRQHGTFQRYPYDPNQPEKLSRPYLRGARERSSISFITEAGGDIWIGADRGGLNRYNPVTKELTHFEPGSIYASGLQDQSIWSGLTTQDGVLFLGTCCGASNLYSVNPSSVHLILHETPGAVSTFYEDTSGRIWLGSGDRAYD
jgi:ligand-binding sensor domain-containing protein